MGDGTEGMPADIGIDPNNQLTVAAYEQCAIDYALATKPATPHVDQPLLQVLRDALRDGATVLEVGSGPGWDADWLEQAGLTVRRTDATEAFLAFQKQRGKTAGYLDVVRGPIDGSYDAILAMYVFQHVGQQQLPAVLGKVSAALRAGGHLFFTILEGTGEVLETSTEGRQYHIARWRKDALESLLASLGMRLAWSDIREDSEGRWLALLFRRHGEDQ